MTTTTKTISDLWNNLVDANYANKITRWCPSDDENRFIAEGNYYTENSFDYRYNSHGFRCDTFDNHPYDARIIFIGCSITFGCGVPVTDSFGYQVINKFRSDDNLHIPYWNLAHCSKSIDYIARTLTKFVPVIKPDLVIIISPPAHRREVFVPDKDEPDKNYLHDYINVDYLPNPQFGKHIIEVHNADNDQMNYVRNMELIHNVMMAHNSDYLWDSWDMYQEYHGLSPSIMNQRINSKFDFRLEPRARDGLHPGINVHTQYAKNLYNEIKPKILHIARKKQHTK